MTHVTSVGQSRFHLRTILGSARRRPSLPAASSGALDAALDPAQLALLLANTADGPRSHSVDFDAYYGSERDAERL